MSYVLDRPRERLSANVSTPFADRPVLDRPPAAVAAGFSVIESRWPFPDAEPGAAELDRFAASDQLARGGYLGDVGLEFVPTGPVGCPPTRSG